MVGGGAAELSVVVVVVCGPFCPSCSSICRIGWLLTAAAAAAQSAASPSICLSTSAAARLKQRFVCLASTDSLGC